MPRNTGKNWTEEDKELLVKKYVTSDYHSPNDLVAIFGRSLWALTCQLNRLGYTGADLVAAQLDYEQKLIKDSQKMNDVTSRESKPHLRAAAPELYEALEKIIEWYDKHHLRNEPAFQFYHSARAALAKARGETPMNHTVPDHMLDDIDADNRDARDLEPTEGQLELQEVLFDMKPGEVFTIRGMQTNTEYKVVGCEPFLGKGKVTIHDDVRNRTYVEDLPGVVACFELVAIDFADEYMVSVDGARAPKHVHLTYESACDEAVRLARKNIGKKVRVLKLEHVIKAEQHVEVKECQ